MASRFAGLKKQINKANQYVSEKMGSAEGTKMEDEFIEMERKTDALIELVANLTPKTKEYLQPNATYNAKVKMHMTQPDEKYPYTEGLMGDVMMLAGQEIGQVGKGSDYAAALLDFAGALHELAETRHELDEKVHSNFLGPLHDLEANDLKELTFNRKKLQGRRLDYDCKKRKGNKVSIEEIKTAQFKFEESKNLCKQGMAKLLGNEMDMIEQLCQLVVDMLEYHKKSTESLEIAMSQLNKRIVNARRNQAEAEASAPKQAPEEPENVPEQHEKAPESTNPLAKSSDSDKLKPSCKAKFDYKAKKEGELSFTEGQIITLSGKRDDEWYEGTLDGKFGIFPSALVQILTDLPAEEATK
ncbi:predicted protein [Nematostella vectensis]|uniref:Uncharacterized protein n=1 Tax=Nematostella vectensis TaxID=45351 RepID=A7RMW0_NEMVE|nr:predicted protein [Nematostella vectensis]|eukprot:XP_001639275.1 predicted protein [Nematostella vectensis]